MTSVMAIAAFMHERKCDLWRGPKHPGLARPFGRPEYMPPHHWRVSWDVMQALTEASPPPDPLDNPKTSEGATKLLFGWPVLVDQDAQAGTLSLVVSD